MTHLVSIKVLAEMTGYSEAEILDLIENKNGFINGKYLPYRYYEREGGRLYEFPLEEVLAVLPKRITPVSAMSSLTKEEMTSVVFDENPKDEISSEPFISHLEEKITTVPVRMRGRPRKKEK